MNDDYSHFDSGLIYITESVPGPATDSIEYEKLIASYNSQLTQSCNCVDKCSQDFCKCNKNSGDVNYIEQPESHKMLLNNCKIDTDTPTPTIECNDMCSCPSNCGNRVVQKGPIEGLYVKSCQNKKKGLGLFTENDIPIGSFICEYAGEIITKAQAFTRHHYNSLNAKMNYIFCLNEHCNETGILQTFVDPSYIGNIGRYINHSCEPNCVIIPVRVNTPLPKLAVFSCKNIIPHSEITFCYGSHHSGNSMLVTASERKICCCDSLKCTGWMPYEVY